MGLKQRYDIFDADLLGDAFFTGKYEFPKISANHFRPRRVVSFDHITKNNRDNDLWLHFYVYDHRFQSLLKYPYKYLPVLQKYAGIIGIDNSVYRDLPLAEQIHNIYLNRVIDYFFQRHGIPVIPNLSWGDFRSFDFCFDGIPRRSTVSVSTYGCIKKARDREYFLDGYHAMLKYLSPDAIVFHGSMPPGVKEMTDPTETLLLPVKNRLQNIFFRQER